MNKVIRDGQVAVLVSPGYGAGWYSWNPNPRLLFDPQLVELVEQGRANEITDEWVEQNLGIKMHTGGAANLEIHWLPVGTAFEIDDYHGNEVLKELGTQVMVA